MESAIEVLLVLTTMPDSASAEDLAEKILNKNLATCVNVLAEMKSIYKWKGQIRHGKEHQMFIKTHAVHYQALQKLIKDSHPYELPEIIAIPVSHGLPEYLNWVKT